MASSPACRANVGGNYEAPWVTSVYVSDHSCEKDGVCTDVPWDVDEGCVNKQLQIGTYLGKFGALNNCQTFANSVLNKCSKPWLPQRSKAHGQ
jgi:hypothetical protein